LENVNRKDSGGEENSRDGRNRLSDRYPTGFGIGIVVFAIVSSSGGIILAYVGAAEIWSGHKARGALVLMAAVFLCAVGIGDLGIAWLMGWV
jgi:hypothetical protein